MKVVKKASVVNRAKTLQHILTERSVLEAVRDSPFHVTLHYAFQTNDKLHLILGKKGEDEESCLFIRLVRSSRIALQRKVRVR